MAGVQGLRDLCFEAAHGRHVQWTQRSARVPARAGSAHPAACCASSDAAAVPARSARRDRAASTVNCSWGRLQGGQQVQCGVVNLG